MENGLFGSNKASAGGAIPKTGKSKFYSELSFDDDFNPTSIRNQNPSTNFTSPIVNNHLKEERRPIATPREITPITTTTTDVPRSHDDRHASPLMCYVVRLKRGDELRKTLLSFAKKNGLKAAFIMTCVGSAISAKIRVASATPDNEANYMLDIIHPSEIVSLEGTLSGGGHIHVGLSDSAGKMVGGHLLELTIDTTAEVVIGDCSALSFTRVYDDSTGFHELNVHDR